VVHRIGQGRGGLYPFRLDDGELYGGYRGRSDSRNGKRKGCLLAMKNVVDGRAYRLVAQLGATAHRVVLHLPDIIAFIPFSGLSTVGIVATFANSLSTLSSSASQYGQKQPCGSSYPSGLAKPHPVKLN
jgi:hypothetical protein